MDTAGLAPSAARVSVVPHANSPPARLKMLATGYAGFVAGQSPPPSRVTDPTCAVIRTSSKKTPVKGISKRQLSPSRASGPASACPVHSATSRVDSFVTRARHRLRYSAKTALAPVALQLDVERCGTGKELLALVGAETDAERLGSGALVGVDLVAGRAGGLLGHADGSVEEADLAGLAVDVAREGEQGRIGLQVALLRGGDGLARVCRRSRWSRLPWSRASGPAGGRRRQPRVPRHWSPRLRRRPRGPRPGEQRGRRGDRDGLGSGRGYA